MSEIHVKENESLDAALKRFKRSCAKAGVLADLRKKEYYQSPSVKRRKKSEAARKRGFCFCQNPFLELTALSRCAKIGKIPESHVQNTIEITGGYGLEQCLCQPFRRRRAHL